MKQILLILVILGLIYLIYHFFFSKKGKNENESTSTNQETQLPWFFDDNAFINDYPGGNLAFVSKNAHPFIKGDSVLIKQNIPNTNPQYDGLATVIAVPDNHTVVVNKGFGKNSPAEGGTINLALA